MHDKHKLKFARLWIQDHLKSFVSVAVFFLPIVLLVWWFSSEKLDVQEPETGTYLSHQTSQSEEGAKRYWMIELSDRNVLKLRARTLVQPNAGDKVCVRRVIGENTGLTTLRFQKMGECS